MSVINSFLIFGTLVSVVFSIISLLYVYKNRNKYYITSFVILIIFMILLIGVCYSIIYVLSITFYFSTIINILLWKISNLFHFIILGIGLFIMNISQKNKKKLQINFSLLIVFLSLIIGAFIIPNSVLINQMNSIIDYNYAMYSQILILLNLAFFLFLYLYYTIYDSYSRRKKVLKELVILNLLVLSPLIALMVYIGVFIPIFKYIHILALWINYFITFILILKKPNIFFNISNKVYNINIYHKSGILLYSYFFNSSEKKTNSATWGQILIGINYILSEFIEKKNKIDLLKTINSEIAVKYIDTYGFAILVFADQKNMILDDIIDKFTNDFIEKYKKELTEISDLNKLINVSEFNGVDILVKEHFQIYLEEM